MHPREFISAPNDDTIVKTNSLIQNLPFISISLGDLKLEGLIDTGAEFSLINETLVNDNLSRFKDFIIPIKVVNLITANNKKINAVRKQLNYELNMGGKLIKVEMLVVPSLSMDMIVGMNILKENNMIVNLEENVLLFEGKKIPFLMCQLESTEQGEVKNINCIKTKGSVNNLGEYEEDIDDVNKLDCMEGYADRLKGILGKFQLLLNEEQGLARSYVHHLEVINEEAFNCRSYPVPYAYKNKVREEIDSMLEKGIIERSSTCFINPVVVVKKKDGNIRLCLDARQINKRTVPQYESPQNIDSIIGKLGGKFYFSKLDLKNSFWLIPLGVESRKYTGFSIDGNVYQFRVVPFGLSTSCAALVRAMQMILNKYEEFCSHYIDDIIIFSESLEDHFVHLNRILGELNDNGLKLNLEKCEFCKGEVKFLGFNINKEGVVMDKGRLKDIQEYPVPKNLRTLRGFLGILNYYRRFIPNLANKVEVLQGLLKKGIKWKWEERHDKAFNRVKDEFCKSIMVFHPDYEAQFILRTDASDIAIAGELVQFKGDVEMPISFVSRTLRSYERNYTVTEKEMAAIVFAIMKLKFYLTGNKFIIETDHGSLVHIMNTRFANSRIYRWTLLIQEFDFEIRHIAGKNNVVADGLSRKDENKLDKLTDIMIALNQLREIGGIFDKQYLRNIQERDEFIRSISVRIANGEQLRGYFVTEEGIIGKKIGEMEIYITSKEHILEIAKHFHIYYGHIGVRKLWMLVRENYCCKRDIQIIKGMVKECHICCLGKYRNHINRFDVKNVQSERPLDLIAIDFLSNLVNSRGKKHMLIMVDVFSKYTKIYPCRKCNTQVALNCIESFVETVGKPVRLLADNATYFNNQRFKEGIINQGIKIIFCSIRHPQGNPSERYIQEVIKYLRILLVNEQHRNWVNYTGRVETYINEVPSTVTGVTPVLLMEGRQAERPWDTETIEEVELRELLNTVKERIRKRNERYVRNENKKIKKQVQFNEGDLVVMRALRVANRAEGITEKLLLPFSGPFKIGQRWGNTYELLFVDTDRVRGRFNIQMLYPYEAIRE